MSGIVRKNDLDSGVCDQDCDIPRSNQTCSSNVYVNNQSVVRKTDLRKPHCGHTAQNLGSHSVYVNNLDIQIIGDITSCGTIQIEGSSDTFVE